MRIPLIHRVRKGTRRMGSDAVKCRSPKHKRQTVSQPGILKITEIYSSVQGESSYAGLPCVFVRLSGCPLRCRWCDTVYSFKDGEAQGVDDVIGKVASFGIGLVELTGGEPLAQETSFALIDALVDRGFKVLIETGGSEPISRVHPSAHVIMDIKCPASGMSDKNLWNNIDALKLSDEVKFVVADRSDFDWAVQVAREFRLEEKCNLLFSPAWGHCKPDELVRWLLDEKLKARLNLQIHKYIWGPRAKGV